METGLESQVAPGMAMKPGSCTEAEVWAVFRRSRMMLSLHLYFAVVWMVTKATGFLQVLERCLGVL